jgi:hypothetical protein
MHDNRVQIQGAIQAARSESAALCEKFYCARGDMENLKVLSAATFLIFFQAYMLSPRLSALFGISAQQIGLIVPAYLIPYGVFACSPLF